jgi:type II secretory pathway pseudopilin PulG
VTPHRHAFSLVELLVATGIIVVLLALVFTIWRGTQQAVERARAVIHLDLRARDIAGQALFALDNRSGVLPLALQNEAYGSQWPYRVYAFMSNAERGNGSSTNTTPITQNDPANGNNPAPRKWVRELTAPAGDFLVWRNPPSSSAAEPAPDAYAPGIQQRTGDELGNGLRWAPAPVGMWHGTVVPIDAGKRYLTGQALNPQWALLTTSRGLYTGTAHLQNGRLPDYRSMHPYTPGMHYRGDFVSQGATNANSALHGPYRGTLVVPWRIHADPNPVAIPWLCERTALRIVNGPGFLFEPVGQRTPGWVPIRTGIYGLLENNLYRMEPDWFQGEVASPTLGVSRPAYGSRIIDNGVIWRVEAPNLYSFGPAAGDSRLQRVLLESASWTGTPPTLYLGVVAPESLTSAGIHFAFGSGGQSNNAWNLNPGLSLLQANFDGGTNVTPILSSPYRPNVSEFEIRTGKTMAPAAVPRAVRGRFRSLTAGARTTGGLNANPAVRPWTDSATWINSAFSVNRLSFIGDLETTVPAAELPWQTHQIGQFHMAGFHGSLPNALTPPGHPAWASITVGVVGGFANRVDAPHLDTRLRDSRGIPQGILVSPAAIERRWSLGTGLR